MSHHHHDHSHHEHPICIATIIYNVLVLAVELIIIGAVNHMTWQDLLGYEGVLQGVHLLGIVILGIINWRWIHRWSKHHDSRLQTAGKFLSVSTLLFGLHIVLLHIVPRIIGFELHHDEGGSETIEFIVLAAIILFVTVAFRWRDALLHKTGLKNKFTVSLKKSHEKTS